MPPSDLTQWGWGNSTAMPYWTTTAASGSSIQVVPGVVMVQEPEASGEPEPESHIGWLKKRVGEITELAFA